MSHTTSDALLARMMALHPKEIDLTLDRMWRLLGALGNPQDRLPPVIHIAGTNGKGSTLAMIRAGLEAAGERVHAYTSPHLARFHERIRLAGTDISEPALVDLLTRVLDTNGDDTITFFEATTAAGLLAFSEVEADHLLLEVGLGGVLDATNVVTPEISVITPISIDHTEFLGHSLAGIAGEKAGIIKRGVPCVVGPQEEAALEVIEAQAARMGAPLHVYGQHWHVSQERDRLVFQDETGLLDLPRPALIGDHQILNAGAALMALRLLGHGEEHAERAMSEAVWPARMQRLRHGPLVEAAGRAELWLDGGHNPAAGQALGQAVDRLPNRPLHLICGMLGTKDVSGFIAPLAARAQSLTAVTIPGAPATLPAEETARIAAQVGLDSRTAPDVASALTAIASQDPTARILICGSLYLAGDVLKQNG